MLRRLRSSLTLAALALMLAAVAGAGVATAAPPSPRAILSVAGTGAACADTPGCGDGGPAGAAALSYPEGVATDTRGDLYVVDWGQSTVRRIAPDGRVSTVAGDGVACESAPDCGDGSPAAEAELNFPSAVAVDARGEIFIADTGDDEVREVLANGRIERVAGTGVTCSGAAPCGDGGQARSAELSAPGGVAVDAAGDLFIADTGDQRIREVSPAGTITTVAGTGAQCASPPGCGDGGSALSGQLSYPESVAVDPAGRLFVADDGDNEIRTIAKGRITRLAGTGVACTSAPACGDGGQATLAELASPQGVAVDGAGNVVIADWGDSEIRVVSKRGTITRLAGSGATCAAAPGCGDGGAAASALLGSPEGVAADAAGNVWIADTFDNRVRLVPAARPGAQSGRGAPALFVLGTTSARRTVGLRFVTSAPASLSLTVTRGKARAVTVARVTAPAGLGQLVWNGRLNGRAAPRGRYMLTVQAHTAGGSSVAVAAATL